MGETVAVREGEDLAKVPLLAWLHKADGDRFPAKAALEISQFPAGFSNLTYLVRVLHDGAATEFVLRRPPRGKRAGNAHDVAREHGILTALHPLGVPVPRPIACCNDDTIIGAPFYVMERVRGVILRGQAPAGVALDAPLMARLSETFVATLAQLHAVNVNSSALSLIGRPDGYVQRQVLGWKQRWNASRTDAVPDMETVGQWLEDNQPPESGAALIHNDFKYDNFVLDANELSRVTAILDWEMATVGDPLMDLGTSLAYWVQADDAPVLRSLGLGITSLPGNATRAQLVQMYAKATGRDVSNAPFHYAFGLFKVAVIAQQIYARYKQGMTSDARFAALLDSVRALAASGVQAVQRQTL